MLDHSGIAALIPHQGAMCLLETVVACSEIAIDCLAISHRNPANPLRAEGRLGAANGIEYAAQAMAVHGALLAGQTEAPRQGYLASVRSVRLLVERLDDLPQPLAIHAERLSGEGNHILYQFALSHAGQLLLDGRAAVVLDADTPQEFRP
ncbi:MAG: 3-hydroxylacyl-ACP dehydratase [Betaproteobacteria bacterium HGW-Betaproteobacteria-7]|nr:MAG: 3-hydroxylacyl-ACP dehydratase [Betaproteobacteria bacterium HGW-Betaproteobacteria-7]